MPSGFKPSRGRRSPAALLGGTLLLLWAWAAPAEAQKISVSGNPATMTINNAVAGQDPTSVTNAATTYGVDTKLNKPARIAARLNTAMPAGVTLHITLAAPSGATSLGAVALTTVAQDVVTNIPGNLKQTGFTITYQLSATPSAGVVSLSSRSVTLEIIEL